MQPSVRRFPRRILAAALALAALAAHAPQAAAQQFNLLRSFSRTDGFGPMAGVIQGPDGAIYGTTSQGGASDLGTVFRIDRATQAFDTRHAFNGADGSLPYGGLLGASDRMLYGTTYAGGAANLGTVFRMSMDGTSFATLHGFSGTDGARPDDLALQQPVDGGPIFGASSEGGAAGGGTLFAIDPGSAALATRWNFAGPAGVDVGIVRGSGGVLYGTTYSGGAYGAGSVFRFDPATGVMTTLHDFSGPDGQNPVPGALMLRARDGLLYGTTQLGGYGTVYQLDPANGAFRTLHTFTAATGEGRMPLGGLTDGGDGWLYGTTVLGGWGYGTVYRVDPATLAYAVVLRFGGSNGRMPSGNLLRADDGWLYGTTRVGGAASGGTVYRISFDTTAPVIDSIAPDYPRLAATNKMVTVNLTAQAHDEADAKPVCRITGVTANQPIGGDWAITGELSVSLRARRSGGADRIYTIAVQCADASGNAASGSTTVTVVK